MDPQEAFRVGLRGRAFAEAYYGRAADGDAATPATGANEALILATPRLPGLTEARAAFETGRVLRAIAKLLDRAAAPAQVGQQFCDNLCAAAIAHVSRRMPRPWGAEDTVAMFMEMYRRVLGPRDAAFAKVQDALLAYAKDELAPVPGTRPRPAVDPIRRRPFGAGG